MPQHGSIWGYWRDTTVFDGLYIDVELLEKVMHITGQISSKKALIENVNIRTNWIKTIEKLFRNFNLIETPSKKVKDTTKTRIPEYFKAQWKINYRMRTYQDFAHTKIWILNLPRQNIWVYLTKIEKLYQKLGAQTILWLLRRVDKKILKHIPTQWRAYRWRRGTFLLKCGTYSILREEYQMNF